MRINYNILKTLPKKELEGFTHVSIDNIGYVFLHTEEPYLRKYDHYCDDINKILDRIYPKEAPPETHIWENSVILLEDAISNEVFE